MKAISPLIATAILLIITVAGGLIIYNYVYSSLSSPQQYAALNIVSAKMVVLGNNTVINIKIANIGTAKADVYEAVILPLNISKTLDLVVEPGTTKSINIFIDTPLDTNTKYYIIIKYNDDETEPYQITIIK